MEPGRYDASGDANDVDRGGPSRVDPRGRKEYLRASVDTCNQVSRTAEVVEEGGVEKRTHR